MDKPTYQPVIIIGAPRSGTNMLRDVLVQIPKIETWPCDEINYIWRHGNLKHSSDVFSVDLATSSVSTYIRNQFDRLGCKNQAAFVVEKTCANSLRVSFVDRIMPSAKYIFIVRNGKDVVSSAMKRWQAKLDLQYILRKVPYVPLSDLPYYAARYIGNRMYRLFSREKRLAFWGPRLENMDYLVQKYELAEICAIQWQQCVDKATEDLARIGQDRVLMVKYEDFVNDGIVTLRTICHFLEISVTDELCREVMRNVSPGSVGKGWKELGGNGLERVMPLIENTLKRHDYC